MKKNTKPALSLTKKTLPKEAIEAIRKANSDAGTAKVEYANLCIQEDQVSAQLQKIVLAKKEAMAKINSTNEALSEAAAEASRSVGIDPNNKEQWTIQVDAGTIERVG